MREMQSLSKKVDDIIMQEVRNNIMQLLGDY